MFTAHCCQQLENENRTKICFLFGQRIKTVFLFPATGCLFVCWVNHWLFVSNRNRRYPTSLDTHLQRTDFRMLNAWRTNLLLRRTSVIERWTTYISCFLLLGSEKNSGQNLNPDMKPIPIRISFRRISFDTCSFSSNVSWELRLHKALQKLKAICTWGKTFHLQTTRQFAAGRRGSV